MIQENFKELSNKSAKKILQRRIRVFCKNKLAIVGLVIILIYILGAIFIDVLSPYDAFEPNLSERLLKSSWEHPLGTDNMGRDLLTRMFVGGRNSIVIAISAAFTASIIGVIFGAIGGYCGGIIDKLFLRLSEIINCIPQIVLVLVLTSIYNAGVLNLIIIFGLTGWTGTFRLVRAEYISLREETYVKVCTAFGMSRFKIMFKQILPSALTAAIVQFTLSIPGYVMSEAGLSFLGFGVPKSVTTWGGMLNAAQSINILINKPLVWLVPGLAICIFILSVNFFGDGLRDALDPHQI